MKIKGLVSKTEVARAEIEIEVPDNSPDLYWDELLEEAATSDPNVVWIARDTYYDVIKAEEVLPNSQ